MNDFTSSTEALAYLHRHDPNDLKNPYNTVARQALGICVQQAQTMQEIEQMAQAQNERMAELKKHVKELEKDLDAIEDARARHGVMPDSDAAEVAQQLQEQRQLLEQQMQQLNELLDRRDVLTEQLDQQTNQLRGLQGRMDELGQQRTQADQKTHASLHETLKGYDKGMFKQEPAEMAKKLTQLDLREIFKGTAQDLRQLAGLQHVQDKVLGREGLDLQAGHLNTEARTALTHKLLEPKFNQHQQHQEIDEEVTKVADEINHLSDSAQQTQSQLASLDSQIGELRGDIRATQTNIQSLSSQVLNAPTPTMAAQASAAPTALPSPTPTSS